MIGEPFLKTYLSQHMDDFYAGRLWEDFQDILQLYSIYTGEGQTWETAGGLDYTPTKRITNHLQHLIKEEARFMFSRTPEITIVPLKKKGEDTDDANKALCEALESHVRQVLEQSGWQRKLTMAGRDCFIGKRVALKISGRRGAAPFVQFRPSLEFFHEAEYDDEERLTRIVFSYNRNNATELSKQRIWIQTYTLEDGRCFLDEAIYDGNGTHIEHTRDHEDTGLPYIPVFVIVNDGLLGDSLGESDVKILVDLQKAYNRMTSDDQDALRFNMFPQRVFTDASEESVAAVKIAPGAMVDLQTDAASLNRQAQFGILESGFNYDSRFENAVERVKSDMYELLSVPKATTEDYKGVGISGKAMRALYWPLISRCEEKWATWDTALKWMVRCLVDMERVYGSDRFAKARFIIGIEHLYPITDDEEAERQTDLTEVTRKARSVKGYIGKWQPNIDADAEIKQIAVEQRLMEDAYLGAVTSELGRDSP